MDKQKKIIDEIIEQKVVVLTGEQEKQKRLKREINKKKSDNRAKTKVRRLINSNMRKHKEKDKFITLTIRENEMDRMKTNLDFKNFIKRLKYKHPSFEYIAILEKQKRGSIHYHVVFFGLPYVKKEELQELWRKGFVKVNAIDSFDDLGRYLVKYMTKDMATGRAEDQKRYLASRGLKKPVELLNIDIEDMIESEYLQLMFKKQFESEYVGEVAYLYCNKTRERG